MANAQVGDDVFGEYLTVVKLQENVAALLGKEKALYCTKRRHEQSALHQSADRAGR